ncbi:MAG: hypothetical protein PHX38_06935 [Sulfuricella sp.]|nr:hypothetical protein [Sulfuricella sp.]
MTLLSTTSTDDLSAGNNDLVRFSTELPGIPEQKYLAFAHQWLVGSASGCSCGFRHLHTSSVELGFGEPQDWYPEEAQDVEATRQVIAAIRALVEKGDHVDCMDAWAHGQPDAPPLNGEVEVNLGEVGDASFRFFENHRFTFTT